MKSPTTSTVKGFLLPEIMIAFSLMTLFLVSSLALSATSQGLREQALKKLERLPTMLSDMASSSLLRQNYAEEWGRDNCSTRLTFDKDESFDRTSLYSKGTDLGSGNTSTDIEVRNGVAYVTADSGNTMLPDFFIMDLHDATAPRIISSFDTGPGLASLEVAGSYAYVSNLGTTNQFQVIDIRNRASPTLRAKLKLPLPHASSTAPFGTSIFYSRGLVYLGTEKWEGKEFAIIDVSSPENPRYIGGLETNTLIHDIYVRGTTAYLAASDTGQMRSVDVSNPRAPVEIESFSPSGSATQQGKVLSYFDGILALGRTTGGFNVASNHEAFIFSTSSTLVVASSMDIPGGVYGMLLRPPHVFLGTRSPGHEFQIWRIDFSSMVFERLLGFLPSRMTCDGENMYFATGDARGVAVLKLDKKK